MARIVLSVGGSVLGREIAQQERIAGYVASGVADLVEQGHQVLILPGTARMEQGLRLASFLPPWQRQAMTGGYCCELLRFALQSELSDRGTNALVQTLSVPIMTEDSDEGLIPSSQGKAVLPLPLPEGPLLLNAIPLLLCCGRPARAEGRLQEDEAARWAAMASQAKMLLFLTDVEQACLHFSEPEEQPIRLMSADKAEQFLDEGLFGPGMAQKVAACARFAREGGIGVITCLQQLSRAAQGKGGTWVVLQAPGSDAKHGAV